MKDLTQGSVARHLLSMAAFIGIGLGFQSAYFLVDLYFVSALGSHVMAGVSAAGNSSFLVMAASQLIGVGVTSLVARASGAKDQATAQTVFNQSLVMSVLAAGATLVAGYALAGSASGALTADAASAAAGAAYLRAFLPSLAAMFPTTALIAALRGRGVVQPTMLVQTGSILLNVLLAPVLIAGWLTHRPLGAAGAGLASSIASLVALAGLALWFPRIGGGLAVRQRLLAPRLREWWRIASIGLPVAGEFAMLFVVTTVIYWVIRHFGAAAQAGFGVGSRIMTSIFLPAMAIAFAVAPVAGQNMGARRPDRVRATGTVALVIVVSVMAVLSLLCHLRPQLLAGLFTTDQSVIAVAAGYLSIVSYNFMVVGVVFVCSGLFQAMGNTVPSFVASASRLLTYCLPAILLQGHVGLHWFWYLSVASTTLQGALSLALLWREMRRRLGAVALTTPLAA